MAEIRAVVSDFGGVLTTPLINAFLRFQDEFGIEAGDFGEAMSRVADGDGEIPLYALERGELSEPEFIEKLSDGLEPILGHRPAMHRFSELMFAGLDPNQEMIELMRELKGRGLRMAMLTNNVREWEPRWRPMLPVDEIFETVVDSAFVGARKPEARIYEITLDRIGMEAAECIFVDDLLPNIEAARELGFNAIHFQDNEQAIGEIRAALG